MKTFRDIQAKAATPAANLHPHRSTEELHRALLLWCSQNAIPLTPMLYVRSDELAGSYQTMCFLETEVAGLKDFDTGPGAERTLASGLALIEALGKARERFRKAAREFQQDFAPKPQTAPLGLADIMKPILLKGEGVLEDAIAYKQEKDRLASARPALSAPPEPSHPHPTPS